MNTLERIAKKIASIVQKDELVERARQGMKRAEQIEKAATEHLINKAQADQQPQKA